ncbi:MAG: HAD family phosphatase [Clostridiales bacterium]|nr:HAD family phosphatase [Clostridiales bacterium]
MIRLIASDMDGSLLDEHKQIPAEFFEIFPLLRKKGISFVVASGRSYCTLKQNFGPVSGQIDYICDNGAHLVHNGRAIVTPLPPDLLKELIEQCDKLQGAQVLLCGRNGTYHKPYSHEFDDAINRYYINQKPVDNLTEIDDEIFKIAIYDRRGSENYIYPVLHGYFGESLSMQIGGEKWMDIMCRGVNKGAALKKIQDAEGILFEETMAFGDYYNDIELLNNAYYSFAMENSAPDMKRHARFVAAKNSEAGVVRAIREYALNNAE